MVLTDPRLALTASAICAPVCSGGSQTSSQPQMRPAMRGNPIFSKNMPNSSANSVFLWCASFAIPFLHNSGDCNNFRTFSKG